MIVVTLLESSVAGIRTAMAQFDDVAHAFEVRLDALSEPVEPKTIRALTRKPLIATCRRFNEGGTWRGPEPERLARLVACGKAGFEHVDVEGETTIDLPERGLLRSIHDFDRTPPADETLPRLEALARGGAIVKFASRVRSPSDGLELVALSRRLKERDLPFAVMGLGEFPRPLFQIVGARFLYGGGRRTAPHQPGARQLAETLLRWGSPGPAKDLFLVVGSPIAHSLSPALHNACFEALGVDAAYGAIELASQRDLQRLLKMAPSLGLRGLNVTSPLKEPAARLVDRRTPEAEVARSVNTIRFEEGAVLGHNTDGLAARSIVHARFGNGSKGLKILVLGSGGAARGILPQLSGATLTLASRNPDSGGELAKAFKIRTIALGEAPERLGEFDLLLNATRVEDPVPLARYSGGLFDLHYGDGPTAWERFAAEHGNALATGRELLVGQAALAFRFWLGRDPPEDAMRKALEVRA